MKLLPGLIILLLQYQCYANYSKTIGSVNTHTQDSTSIKFVSTKGLGDFYFRDYYGETSAQFDLSKCKSPCTYTFAFDKDATIFINASDGKPNTKTFDLHPAELVTVYGIGSTVSKLLLIGTDSIRTNEVNFIPDMNKYVGMDLEGYYHTLPRKPLPTTKLIDTVMYLRNKRIDFLNRYKEKNPISSDFEKSVLEKINSDMYQEVVMPYASGYKPMELKIEDFIQSYPVHSNSKEIVDGRAFTYTYYLNLKLEKKYRDNAQFLFETAADYFEGKTRDRVLFEFLGKAFRDGHDSLEIMIDRYSILSKDQALVSYSHENFATDRLAKNKDLNQTLLVGQDGQEITWKDLLLKNKGKVVYMDFWASWCAPCVAEMPASHELRESYDDREVTFIYVSIDDLQRSWLNSVGRVGLKNYQNSYRLKEGKKSKIKTTLNVGSIPRYMVFDKKSILKIPSAPRPGEKEIKSYIVKFL